MQYSIIFSTWLLAVVVPVMAAPLDTTLADAQVSEIDSVDAQLSAAEASNDTQALISMVEAGLPTVETQASNGEPNNAETREPNGSARSARQERRLQREIARNEREGKTINADSASNAERSQSVEKRVIRDGSDSRAESTLRSSSDTIIIANGQASSSRAGPMVIIVGQNGVQAIGLGDNNPGTGQQHNTDNGRGAAKRGQDAAKRGQDAAKRTETTEPRRDAKTPPPVSRAEEPKASVKPRVETPPAPKPGTAPPPPPASTPPPPVAPATQASAPAKQVQPEAAAPNSTQDPSQLPAAIGTSLFTNSQSTASSIYSPNSMTIATIVIIMSVFVRF